MIGLSADAVGVTFPLYHGESRSLKKTVLTTAAGRFKQSSRRGLAIEALRDISLSLHAGDRLGLVGANGAGKTTLLRLMAGIYEPVAGRLVVNGAVTALLDPGQGLNMDLTGRENIRLRALFSGYREARIRQLQEDVASFTNLGAFLDLPVRSYSAGMIVRLSFAMATAVKPQILLMDEWLLAGDAAFMEQAQHRLETVVRAADILVLSSHNNDIIRRWCNRVVWMDEGRIRADGSPDEALAAYLSPK